MVGGFHRGDLVVVAGDSDMASVFASHCVLTAAVKEKVPTGVLSLTASPAWVSLCLLAVHSGESRFTVRQKLTYRPHVRSAAQHLRQLPVLVSSFVGADLSEVEEAGMRLHDHRLVVVEGLNKLKTPTPLIFARLRRLARTLEQSIICPVPSSYLAAADADIILQIEEIGDDENDLSVAEVRIVRNLHGSDGWVNLGWDPHREALGSLATGVEEEAYGCQRFGCPTSPSAPPA